MHVPWLPSLAWHALFFLFVRVSTVSAVVVRGKMSRARRVVTSDRFFRSQLQRVALPELRCAVQRVAA
eukprot:1638429-Alexandrium_andersonii.AAC.1